MEEKKSRKRIVMEFGQRVRQLRMDQKISQSQLAFEAELSREEISRIESGQKNVALETNLALAIGFGITLKELFDFEYAYEQPDGYCAKTKNPAQDWRVHELLTSTIYKTNN